jgi:16S rRNA (adenine1518-N6/adenine1519-N6)-dimethyltransferase
MAPLSRPDRPVSEGYLDPRLIRRLAAELNLRPSKRRGQNFVIDANTVRRIVTVAGVGPGDHVLEVGPGLGSLTAGLLAVGATVTAVEIEPVLARRLAQTMAELQPGAENRLSVIEADALAWEGTPAPEPVLAEDQRTNLDGRGAGLAAAAVPCPIPASPLFLSPSRLVANLPYNVAVPVLLRCLASFPSLGSGLVMVQQEVADRLVAAPGSRVYGVPSAKLAWYAAASLAGSVSASVFWPQPKVESGLIRLTRHDPPATTATRDQVFTVIDAAFGQRRKMLRSALASRFAPDRVTTALTRAGLDPTARGETLGLADFARLAAALA